MKNPKVNDIKTRNPIPGGRRQIVFPNGKLEHTAIIKAPLDWSVSMAVDEDEDPWKFFCVCISPDGDAVTVERWASEKNPSRLEITGGDVTARFGDPLESTTNDIVEEVRDELD